MIGPICREPLSQLCGYPKSRSNLIACIRLDNGVNPDDGAAGRLAEEDGKDFLEIINKA